MAFDFSQLNYELNKIVDSRFQTFLTKVRELDDTLDDQFLKLAWKQAGEGGNLPSKTVEKSSGCPYVPSRGKNSGRRCGTKSKAGGIYCSSHKKYEGSGEVNSEKASTRSEGANSEKISKSVASRTVGGVVGKKPDQERRIRPHFELGKLWHPSSGLTFDNGPDGLQVDGKIVDGVYRVLGKDDLDTVQKWQFPISNELSLRLSSTPLKNGEDKTDDVLEEEPVPTPLKIKPKKPKVVTTEPKTAEPKTATLKTVKPKKAPKVETKKIESDEDEELE